MKDKFNYILIFGVIMCVMIGLFVGTNRGGHMCMGQSVSSEINAAMVKRHGSGARRNLGNCYSSSINIIEKYLTIYMILYILSFYIKHGKNRDKRNY